MPLPKRARLLARLNRRLANPVARLFAGRVPPLAIVGHTGRRSGIAYRVPVVAFAHGDGYLIALTYGPEADWDRNVLARGACTLERSGRTVSLGAPRLVGPDEALPVLSAPVRAVLRALKVGAFLQLTPDPGLPPPAGTRPG
ncbi:MAG: hypothetical protein AVDCRST_MAG49-3631 [uncultured Thermomicrobiales bacterium]|uniref:AclJ n=1 Tax=uncultured Thermomicrobiales bacterium TaxID=1645740 RepID=A0A6J4V741_9BACT|nr:MAG: hypothetical protein AVDCRST_MAG49-3631 [uncultured Thermomicrobiales bacterium]